MLRPSETAGTQTYIAQIDQTDSAGPIDELDQHFYSTEMNGKRASSQDLSHVIVLK